MARATTSQRTTKKAAVPRWDPLRRRLLLGEVLLKEYRQPSEMQTIVLAEFEKQGWPARIDDPLPRSKGVDRRSRLRNTIKRLNLNQRVKLVRFLADGMAAGIIWEHVSAKHC